MRLFPETKIDFMKYRNYLITISLIVIAAGMISLWVKGGPKIGVEFTGGTLLTVQFNEPQNFNELRNILASSGLDNAVIQEYGTNGVAIRIPEFEAEPEGNLREALKGKNYEVLGVEGIGPQVSRSLQKKAWLAILIANAGILAYVGYRFKPVWGLAGVVALVHDVLVTVGFCSFFDKEITLSVIAAFLTLIGFSINDTIVIYDRMRENLKLKKGLDFREIVNLSINQNLARTALTSFTVFLVVVALFFLGGQVIHDFSFVFIIGIITGTYSTVFIAAPIIVSMEKG